MKISVREIKSFFYSQYFSDGIRTSIGILLPALVLNYLNQFALGVTLSLGALCVSVVDIPGPVLHKRNAMAICNLCIFVVAVVTGFARMNVVTLGIEIAIFSFLFSMLIVYGTRAAAVGTGSLLMMIFMIEKALPADQVLSYSLQVTAGGIWYLVFSVLFFTIRPYRAAQQALGESILDVVKFLRIKADFYLPDTDIDENYRKLVLHQIQVSQHQDAVRELLFKSRIMVKESTNASRVLVLTFIDLIDLYEQILATHYDYNQIRERFGNTGILEAVARVLEQMAHELENIGYAVLSNHRYNHSQDFNAELELLKKKIDEIAAKDTGISNLVLKKILINLRDLNKNIHNIFVYYNSRSSKTLIEKPEDVEYSKFVTHQDYAPRIFFDNFSLSSGSFKHALRVSLVCVIGFTIARLFALGHHSYWVLLTIIVILKPGFSLSKQRNYQRLIGTIAGGAIGILVLTLVKNTDAQFVFFIIFMLGTYSFTRLNYVVSVIFMTPYVLILFKFLGVGHLNLAEERIIDTAIGSSIAFIATYIIFPTWEFEQVQENLRDTVYANVNYLVKIAETITGKTVTVTDYKLARKDIYVKSANLSATFERMTSEPKSKQKNIREIHKFVVLTHILSSYLANLASSISEKNLHKTQPDNVRLLRKSVNILNETSKKLGGKCADFVTEKTIAPEEKRTPTANETLLTEQLGFINKISYDIAKVTDNILA
ncbi:FUSC family membrane protein [Mucilaginibacter sp. BT774]|uniref:FUSC family membrane protein n=1 Tax=Mucilaginibacter sp. BT774 TaxID=3062276 RepID=UPI002676164B|nr:FUSC family membrane protein [Mucilaginibacter sp. BT774]MDO3625285.1 FUSC family membrane protein [Mucilaginibacter sp. BT774]